MTNISLISQLSKNSRYHHYCTVCEKRILEIPFYRAEINKKDILEFFGYSRMQCKILYFHRDCFEKIREELEDIEHEGYQPICSDEEWEKFMEDDRDERNNN